MLNRPGERAKKWSQHGPLSSEGRTATLTGVESRRTKGFGENEITNPKKSIRR